MLLRTHFVSAVFVFLLVYGFIGEKAMFLLFLLIATLLPDIDTKKSAIGKPLIFRPIQFIVSHRGIFHTLIFAIISSGIIFLFWKTAGIAFFMGYCLHLFLDCFTVSGIRMFWPVSNWKVSFLFRSGKLADEILFVLLLLIDFVLILKIIFY
jgi:inner membrane protein